MSPEVREAGEYIGYFITSCVAFGVLFHHALIESGKSLLSSIPMSIYTIVAATVTTLFLGPELLNALLELLK